MDPNNPKLTSFVAVAPDSPFPIQNLPYGVFRKNEGSSHCACAIGDFVLDLSLLEEEGYLDPKVHVFNSPSLNNFIRQGRRFWQSTRQKISELLRHDTPSLRDNKNLLQKCLLPQRDVTLLRPVDIGDYTDFYSSQEHATNIGMMVRDPKNPLPANWKHLPVGYHGRASSVVVSETPVLRPWGQLLEGENPVFAPSKRLDFELELAFIIGKDSEQGTPIRVEDADDYIFGFVLMNDWTARDVQRWEYVPLGPFVSKSFATSISAWIVSCDALQPFRTKGPEQAPKPFPYLAERALDSHYDIALEVSIAPAGQSKETRVSRSNSKLLYWSPRQQIAHHTITGCNLRVGDLMASGTISGKDKESFGSLMELSWNGTQPIAIGSETRTFLQDGDSVTMRGFCQGAGYKIGFGEVRGKILHAKNLH